LQVRDFIRRGEMKHLKKFKNDDWNTLDITVRDNVLITTVNGRLLGDKDTLEVSVKDGKTTAKLNGKSVDARNIQVRRGSIAVCPCRGGPLKPMPNTPAKGGIGLQAETGKFEFRHIQIKEMP